ncbi:hypothetical protein NMY22_g4414 [Coprinellus aureogranulatus]|nr:hypothetical protein NMY22_g4414 [Coprinellus aureogranulatus]
MLSTLAKTITNPPGPRSSLAHYSRGVSITGHSTSVTTFLCDTYGGGSSSADSEKPGSAATPQPVDHCEEGLSLFGRILEDRRPVEELIIESQMLQQFTNIRCPIEEVLKSEDIFPSILTSVKHLHGTTENWKHTLTSIIRVDRSWFSLGMPILWHTITSIGPVLRLLPWHGEYAYTGTDAYPYVGEADWSRFLTYNKAIRCVELRAEQNDPLGTHWITELLFLPQRPPNLFPNVHTITLGPGDILTSLPLLQLLVSSPLQSLSISTYSHNSWGSPEDEVKENVQAHLPLVLCRAPGLQDFSYTGPVGRGILHHISLLKSITSLSLEFTTSAEGRDLLCLASLPYLQELRLRTTQPVSPPPSIYRNKADSKGAFEGWKALRVLNVAGVDIFHGIMSAFPGIHHSKLEDVHLQFTRADRAAVVQQTLLAYLASSHNLRNVHIHIHPPPGQQDPLSHFNTNRVSEAPALSGAMEIQARIAFRFASNIESAVFEGIPPSLWRFMSSALQGSIGGWKNLTSLTFRLQPTPLDLAGVTQAMNDIKEFPGLAFLATTVWRECPRLESLEYTFSKAKFRDVDVPQVLKSVKESAPKSLYPTGHPLRQLTLRCWDATWVSDGVALDLDKKMEILMFLEDLFPRLTPGSLSGTPPDLWGDISTLMYVTVLRLIPRKASSFGSLRGCQKATCGLEVVLDGMHRPSSASEDIGEFWGSLRSLWNPSDTLEKLESLPVSLRTVAGDESRRLGE